MKELKHVVGTLTVTFAMVTICQAQANTQLSNLVAPTQVNVPLLPVASGKKDLGSVKKKWRAGYFNGTVYGYGANSLYGIYGANTSAAGYGVYGMDSASGGYGVYGRGGAYGIYGFNQSDFGYGVYGKCESNDHGTGVYGEAGSYGTGVNGKADFNNYGTGVSGTGYTGVAGTGADIGVYGNSSTKYGLYGTGGTHGVYGSGDTYGVYGSSGNWAGYFSGNVYSTGTYQGSDKALKKNIREFNSGLDIINKLKPRQYEYSNDGNYAKMNLPTGNHYGLIAQDVQEVLPDLVKETAFEVNMQRPNAVKTDENKKPVKEEAVDAVVKSETINFKAVNYTELIPILIKAVQELDAENTVLNQKNAELENKLATLTQIVSQLTKSSSAISISSASLGQNFPNPFSKSTNISFNIPKESKTANIVVNEIVSGKIIKSVTVSGSSQITLDAASLAAGAYNYSLFVDGKLVATKQMILAK